jgi:hypothetical protein
VATNITSTSATITWQAATDNVGVDHYTVYLQNPAYTPPDMEFTTPTNATTFTITGVPAGTNWDVWVYATDAAGNVGGDSGYFVLQLLP